MGPLAPSLTRASVFGSGQNLARLVQRIERVSSLLFPCGLFPLLFLFRKRYHGVLSLGAKLTRRWADVASASKLVWPGTKRISKGQRE